MRMLGRHAVVTGGAGSLGLAAAGLLMAEGAKVVLADVDLERARAAASRLDPEGSTVLAVACDIADEDSNRNLIDAAEQFFQAPVDLFVANAGVPCAGSILETPAERIRRTIDVNVTGSLLSAQAALRSLVKAQDGVLIFTASLQSVTGRAGRSVYTASKHAIAGMCKSLALEFGPLGVRVNAIAPTAVDTPFLHDQWQALNLDVEQSLATTQKGVPLGRLPEPDDYAQAVLYLASHQSRSVTGHVLMLDCGASAGRF